MMDPRVNTSYRGKKCRSCGEYLPVLIGTTCTYCTFMDASHRMSQMTRKLDAAIEQGKASLIELDGGICGNP